MLNHVKIRATISLSVVFRIRAPSPSCAKICAIGNITCMLWKMSDHGIQLEIYTSALPSYSKLRLIVVTTITRIRLV